MPTGSENDKRKNGQPPASAQSQEKPAENEVKGSGLTYATPVDREAKAPFGSQANALRRKRLNLDTAHNGKKLNTGGSILWAAGASSATAKAKIEIQDESGKASAIPVREGLFIRGIKHNKIYYYNSAQPGEWIDIYYVLEGANLDIVNPTQTIKTVTNTTDDGPFTKADVTVNAGTTAQVFDAQNDPTDSAVNVMITNPSNGPGTVRVGGANVAADQGNELVKGATYSREANGDYYVHNPTGNPVDIQVSWTERTL